MRRFCLQFLISLLLTMSVTLASAQEGTLTPEVPPQEVTLNIEKTKAEAQEAKAEAQAVIASINKFIAGLDVELQKAEEESIRAIEAKEALASRKATALEFAVYAQIEEAAKEKVKLLSERIQVLRERLKVEEKLMKAKDSKVALLERRSRLEQEVAATPLDKAKVVLKEVEIAEAYLQAANAKLKEAEFFWKGLKEKLNMVQMETEEERIQIQNELKIIEELPFRKEEEPQGFVHKDKRLLQIRLYNTGNRLAIAEEGVNVAGIGLEGARVDSDNAQLHVILLKDMAPLLEERLRGEELKKKEEEAQLAREAEKEWKKKAEGERAAVQEEKEQALNETEQLAQKQKLAVSAEQMRALELESVISRLRGEIAKRKEALFTEEMRLSEHATESKKLDRDVLVILGGENTPSEVASELDQLRKETARWKEKLDAISSLAGAIEKEKALLAEQLKVAQAELTAPPGGVSKILEEARAFKDKAMADKFIAHAKERIKLLEDHLSLIDKLVLEIEKEREFVTQNGLRLIADAMEKLNKIRMSNIWARRHWTDSWLSMKKGLAKLSRIKTTSDLRVSVGVSTENKRSLLPAGGGILALVAAMGAGSYYCIRWCKRGLKRMKEINH
ncbi:MAG: hypothetical protein ACYSRP_08150 [Planctomycetota bacterium]|jgi:hypothetical protein